MSDNVTVITADFMYLVIIADINKMKNIVDRMNSRSKSDKIYISIYIDYPCANINKNKIYELYDKDVSNLYIKFAEGVESAQTLTFAEGYNKSYHILLEIEKTTSNICIQYPKLHLEDENEPEKIISKWIRENNLGNLMDKLIIRPVNIVGSNNEILVFAARVQ
jgi:hypothetical protein